MHNLVNYLIDNFVST